MSIEEIDGRFIEVMSIDDARAGEHIIKFIHAVQCGEGSVLAVFNPGERWRDVRVSINPRIPDVSADLLIWALNVSRMKMGLTAE